MRTITVPLGKKIWRGAPQEQEISIPISRFGVGLVIGRSRSGKSSIVKNIIAHVSNKNRRCLIIDPYSEYDKCIHPNFNARPYSMGFKNFKIIKNIVIKIEDMKKQDWMSLGFTANASKLLAELSAHPELHKNDFEKLKEMLAELPSSTKGEKFKKFQEKYAGVVDLQVVHYSTELNLLSKIDWTKRLFYCEDVDGEDKFGRTYIDDWTHELFENNIIVDLDLKKGTDKVKAIVYTGIILRKLRKNMGILKPMIVIEEGDILAPDPDRIGMDIIPSTVRILSDYTIKLQRDDVVIIYITQDHNLLYPELVKNWHWKILGTLDPESRDYKYVKWIKNQFQSTSRGYREFVLLKSDNRYYTFQPYVTPCEL